MQESMICLQHSAIPSLLKRWAQCQEWPVLDTKHLRLMKIFLFMKIKYVLKTHGKHGTFTQCTTSPGHLTPPTGSSRSAWSKSAPIWCSKPPCRSGSVMGIGQWGCLLDPQNADLFSSSYPSGTAGQSILNHGEPYRTMFRWAVSAHNHFLHTTRKQGSDRFSVILSNHKGYNLFFYFLFFSLRHFSLLFATCTLLNFGAKICYLHCSSIFPWF